MRTTDLSLLCCVDCGADLIMAQENALKVQTLTNTNGTLWSLVAEKPRDTAQYP